MNFKIIMLSGKKTGHIILYDYTCKSRTFKLIVTVEWLLGVEGGVEKITKRTEETF